MDLFAKMARIILLSLMTATTALIVLYFILYKLLLTDQVDKAKIATDSLIVMKYTQMLNRNSFDDIIKIYSNKSGIKFKINSFINKKMPYDEKFLKKIKNNEKVYTIKNDYLIYYRPLMLEDECMKCHGGVKKNEYTGFKKGDFIGVLEAKIPIKEQINNYKRTFLLIFVVLGIALIFTLYYFYDYMDKIRNDINTILLHFKEKISKGVYETIKKSMIFDEFEILKHEINNAIKSIVFYRNELIRSYSVNDLTGLPNRAKLIEDLEKERFKLGILNINKFREINDYFGQKTGDELIAQIGERLKNLARSYHINIDEFALPLPHKEKADNIKFLRGILKELEKPYHIEGNEIILTFRCGMSDDDNLLATADIALEYAKRKKEKCLCFCDIKDSLKEFEKNLQILNILVKALKNDRVKVNYQKIIDNKTLEPVKYEALVRIEDEKGNVYSPGLFLDIAKSANLYPEITKTVFKKALEKFKDRKETVSLNLDFSDFENEDVRTYIKDLIEQFPDPKRIAVELLESDDITASKEAVKFLKYLKSKGVQIFIDDFGSGYSNFSYLFNFEITGIKIDGSLIKNIVNDKKSQMIVETIVDFAKKGNMRVLAEFVENENIFKKLLEMGIDCSQGFYFAKPQEII